MDTNFYKSLFPLVGGALALVGGILTFINGRLNQAPDVDSRLNILVITWLCIFCILWFSGTLVSVFTPFYFVSIVLELIATCIAVKFFLILPDPVSRKEITVFVLFICFSTFFMSFQIYYHFISQLLHIELKQVEKMNKITN